jgi:hypothetical protein
LGLVLERIRAIIEDGVGGANGSVKGKLVLDLSVDGKIGGEFSFNKGLGAPWDKQGEVKGALGFAITAEIVAEAAARGRLVEMVFGKHKEVVARAGAGLEVKGAERPSDVASNETDVCKIEGVLTPAVDAQGKLVVDGAIKFNGLAVYYVAYIEAAVRKVPSQVGEAHEGASLGRDEDDAPVIQNKHKHEGMVLICDPWEWPTKPKTPDTTKDEPAKQAATPLKDLLT